MNDLLLIVFELMRTPATRVSGEHTDQTSIYMVYGSTCPRERVVVATHNLAAI
jgi:hypothetical protein